MGWINEGRKKLGIKKVEKKESLEEILTLFEREGWIVYNRGKGLVTRTEEGEKIFKQLSKEGFFDVEGLHGKKN